MILASYKKYFGYQIGKNLSKWLQKWLQDDITKARKLVISRHTDEKKQPIVWLFFFIAS
jgi:hypothetical protein